MIALMRRRAEPVLGTHAFDLLCLTMGCVLGVHASHLPWWLVAALALVLVVRWWQRRHSGARSPLLLKLPLLALLAVAVVFTYGTIFGQEPGSALAVGLLVLKLLESETPRDAKVGVSFACFGLMAALLFDQGLVATFVVAMGLLPALATLRALEPAQAPASLPRALLPGLTLLAAAVPLALLAFALVPRLSSPLWGAASRSEARTGLSDRMSPGNFTELLTDDRPAMRVSFNGPPPAPELRYFRAYVMWLYDGRTWEHVQLRRADGRARPLETLEARVTTGYQIDLEPTDSTVLPALGMPLAAPEDARLSPDREVLSDKAVREPLHYALRSAVHYSLQVQLPEAARRFALRLPHGFNPRTHALAAQWRTRYGADDQAIVAAALALFHDGGFRYTLAPAPLGRDAVDDFLFDTREGFCEHYASSFTVLMRAAGIPARVVTGYQGGYWNPLGNYLLVRQSDAHAWSEVWLEGRGWVRVDPTAAVRPERVSLGAAAAAGDQLGWAQTSWLASLRNRWDVVNHWWTQGVIGFDALRQRGLLTPFGIRETGTAMLGMLLAIGTSLFVAIGVGWALWRRERPEPLRQALRRLEARLARAGITRRRSEGPQHYLRRAARALPVQRDELERLMDRYLELRYAHDEPVPELLREFQRAVREFRPRRVVK
ncbi:transglutaminase TgpA family protein [Frateuria sp. YIM B11624]|uniref:transglutaminase TgpA family protein n=1 Tax=Frateuria sp. YIM B11624 TaxID=3143185 RepID=UPI003C723491